MPLQHRRATQQAVPGLGTFTPRSMIDTSFVERLAVSLPHQAKQVDKA